MKPHTNLSKDTKRKKKEQSHFVGQRYQSLDQNNGQGYLVARKLKTRGKRRRHRSFKKRGHKTQDQIFSRNGLNRKQKKNSRGSSLVKEPAGTLSRLLRLHSCDGRVGSTALRASAATPERLRDPRAAKTKTASAIHRR